MTQAPNTSGGKSVPEQEYTLELGAFAKPFSEQLAGQGLPFDAETMGHLELDAQAASRLKIRGVLAYGVGNATYDKIAKKVWAEVKRSLSDAARSVSLGSGKGE